MRERCCRGYAKRTIGGDPEALCIDPSIIILFAFSVLPPLPEAYPGPTAVLIDELDAGSNNRKSNFFRSSFSPSQFTIRRFEASHGGLRDARMASQIGLGPAQESARGLHLTCRDQLSSPV
jgi:hypothetical protein